MSFVTKLCIVFCILFCFIGFTSELLGQSRQISVSGSKTDTKLTSNSDYGFNLEFTIGDINTFEVNTKAGVFDEIAVDSYGHSNRIGEPKLPVFSKIITVPVGASVSFEIKSQNTMRLDKKALGLTHRIIPAQYSISKSEDPDKVPFLVSEDIYNKPTFSHNEIFRVYEIGYMRGVRVFQLEYEPIQYNPVTGELLVNYDVSIGVHFNNPDFIATDELRAKTASYEFEKTYRKTIFNWRDDGRPSLVRTPTKMLILCPANYTTTLQPFVDWKREQGYLVTVTTVGTGGTVTNSTSAINTYMAGVWSSANAENPAPTYLLIVGDTSTSGDNIIANTGESSTSHVTDLTYVRLNGTDYIPEMYYGRFSVSTATELTNIINKTITFEKTLMPDLSYLGNVVMIAGADASYAPTYGNGQINYGTTHYFNASNGITSNTYLYPASETSDAAIITNANAGRGYMNYTAHGSETSWADPTFSVTNVNAMTNTDKYGVMVGNCCITNKFNYTGGPCFGEAIIRKANAAGVAYIGATNNSYWDEDYWWGIGYKTPIQTAAHSYNATTLGAYDAMFHTHSEAFADWATSVGETNFMGNTAVQQSTSTRKPYYWEIYSIMGDPSLMTYFGVPTVNTATYPNTILMNATSINVTATPYSRVALTMNGTLYGTAIVPANGSLTLPITSFSAVGTAKLVITAQNKITKIADITIAPNSGPYVNVTSTVYSDTNNNTPECNDSGRFSVTFQNIGSAAATNAVATLTTSTSGIAITDNNETIASLAAGASTTLSNAFTFNIANDIAHGTVANFTITIICGAETWINNFSITINAPALTLGSMTISEPTGNNNGRLDPGETATITIPLSNSGGAASAAGSATLTSPTNGITINTGTANFSAIAVAGSTNLSFSVTASAGIVNGSLASFVFSATAGAYTANKTEQITIGIPPTAIIGSGTSTTGTSEGAPINIWYKSLHGQSVYTATELINAGVTGPIYISQLGFYVSSSPTLALPNFIIRMKHTTATNVADWQTNTNMVTVYTNASYMPTAGGYELLTLTTPFLWNGTDNIVLDTAFGLVTDYSQTGTVQYTTVTNGYRYLRSDTVDETNIYTGGSTSTYRPNIKIGLTPYQTNPVIAVNPTTLAFGNVYLGNSSSQSFTVSNTGGGTLTGNITTPAGFTVDLAYRDDSSVSDARIRAERNTLSYSIGANQSRTYNLTFTPTTAQSYNGNVAITSNDANTPSLNISVTATGVTPVLSSPTTLNATISHANVYLTWNAPTGYTGTLSGYKIYRNSTLVTPTPITTLYYNDSGLTNGTLYQYYVTAVYSNPTGESAASNNVNATPMALSPLNLNVSTYHATAVLNWQAPQNGTPYRYKVYRDSAFLATINGLTYTDIGLSNGTTYSYYVTATYLTPSAESAASNSVNALPVALPPLNLIGFDGNATVTLSWQNPSAGTPAFYRVMRDGVYIKNLTATTYIDSNLVNGTSYSYKVKAMYSNPTGESDFTNTVYVTPSSNIVQSVVNGSLVSQGLPMEPYQSYSYSQSIYLQNEINQSNKTINKLYWYYGGGTVFTDAIAVYMGHTSLNVFPSNSSWIPVSQMTQVYNGTITTTATADWIEISISPGFNYNNTQNLVIAVDENTSGRHADTDEFHCYNTGSNRSILFYSMGTNTDPANPPLTGVNLYLKTTVPNLKLSMIDAVAPIITATPSSLSFGSVIIGQTETLTLTLQNTSSQTLSGTVQTPTGYSIALSSRTDDRNTVNFNLNAGQSIQYDVTFAPTAVATYNGSIVITCNNETNSTYQVAVTGNGYAPPTAILNLTEIEMTLSTTQSEITSFSICNTGSQPLNFSINVADSPAWLRIDPVSGSVPASSCFSVNVEFLATTQQPGNYQAELEFNSNAPDLPHQIIDVSLVVYEANQPPTINLPASFSFNKNETLIHNFAPYLSDANSSDVLSLSYVTSRNLIVTIDGTMVTFSASQNWYGSEIVTFTVSDGQSTANDDVIVNVLPTDVPSWMPITYPNNPATVYAVITINGEPASAEDQIAAFVNGECRGTGTIVIANGQAYSTILVNLASDNENVSFKVYDNSVDLIYQTSVTQALTYGQVLGEITPHPISVSSTVSLAAPVVTIVKVATGMKLTWAQVNGATQYKIYCSLNPENGYTCIDTVTECEYIDTQDNPACFFKVTAWDGQASRGGGK
jgi:hypothetical protein